MDDFHVPPIHSLDRLDAQSLTKGVEQQTKRTEPAFSRPSSSLRLDKKLEAG
jgi:hypothetical protein